MIPASTCHFALLVKSSVCLSVRPSARAETVTARQIPKRVNSIYQAINADRREHDMRRTGLLTNGKIDLSINIDCIDLFNLEVRWFRLCPLASHPTLLNLWSLPFVCSCVCPSWVRAETVTAHQTSKPINCQTTVDRSECDAWLAIEKIDLWINIDVIFCHRQFVGDPRGYDGCGTGDRPELGTVSGHPFVCCTRHSTLREVFEGVFGLTNHRVMEGLVGPVRTEAK